MLRYAIPLLVIASIVGVLGVTGITGALIGIAKVLLFLFIVLIVTSLAYSRRRNYQNEPVGQREGMNMKNLLAPIFRLFKRDPQPFVPIKSLTLPIEAQRALPVQGQAFSFIQQVHPAIDSTEDNSQLPS